LIASGDGAAMATGASPSWGSDSAWNGAPRPPGVQMTSRYDGDETFLMVGENEGVGADAAVVAQQQFERLGFHVRLRRLSPEAVFSKFCDVPSAHVAICPNVAWLKDFGDAQTFLDPTFNGENILASGNANWSQLDDPELNELMREAALLGDPRERARAWADIDIAVWSLAHTRLR
jgi:peptide/nickel transport system substrate-binding protein